MTTAAEEIRLSAEATPNPNSIKFVINRQILEYGTIHFNSKEDAAKSLLASRIFEVDAVESVFAARDFVTVTKKPDAAWNDIVPVPDAIKEAIASGEPLFSEDILPKPGQGGDSEIEQKIIEILDNEIRPAVARDGGDITFYGYENGIVTLHLQGACSTCPSSVFTLKMGVENRLKQSIPEVVEVVQV